MRMKQPESLTKNQLKEELIAHGVKLPEGRVLKAVYVNLYYNYVLKNETMNDDRSSSNKDELKYVDDNEIRETLKGFGFNIGPITATTRKVYLKKLAKLLESGDAVTNGAQNSVVEPSNSPPVTRSIAKRRSMHVSSDHDQMPYSRSVHFEDKNSDLDEEPDVVQVSNKEQDESNTQIPSAESPTVKSPTKPQHIKNKTKWVPAWLQVLFIIVVVVFAYFVWLLLENNPSRLTLPGQS